MQASGRGRREKQEGGVSWRNSRQIGDSQTEQCTTIHLTMQDKSSQAHPPIIFNEWPVVAVAVVVVAAPTSHTWTKAF